MTLLIENLLGFFYLKCDNAKKSHCLTEVNWRLWKVCDSKRGSSKSWAVATYNKESPVAALGGPTCSTAPPPRTHTGPSSHQSGDRQQRTGWTSSHLSKSSVTLLLPAAFMPPDTKFKVISSQFVCVCMRVCVRECVWVERVNCRQLFRVLYVFVCMGLCTYGMCAQML